MSLVQCGSKRVGRNVLLKLGLEYVIVSISYCKHTLRWHTTEVDYERWYAIKLAKTWKIILMGSKTNLMLT